MKKFFVALLLMLSIGLAVTASAATITPSKPAGSGTSSDPYLIGTAAQLYWFAETVYGGNADACAKLTADITVNEKVLDGDKPVTDTSNLVHWMSIEGTSNAAYTGTFDGNNHTISGLYAVKTTMYEGFFGELDGATIKNLTIADSYFKSEEPYLGVIAGSILEGEIINCHAQNCVITGQASTAGIAGYNSGGTISKCSNTSLITSAGVHVGGIAGYNDGSISDCYNTGNIAGNSKVGGIAGFFEWVDSSSEITRCYNIGDISAASSSKEAGGIIGNSTSETVPSCYYLQDCVLIGTKVNKGTARTQEQMTSDTAWETSFSGFSTSVWNKKANEGAKAYLPQLSNGYSPYLERKIYTVTIASGISNGSVSTDLSSAAAGETVTLSSIPAEGYLLNKYTVTDANGNAVTVTNGVFTMPASNVTVSATFKIDDSHSHAPCGEDSCTAHDNHTVHAYRAVDDIDDIRLVAGDNYYYLKNDISSSSGITVTTGQTLYLCLNGNDIVRNSGSEVIKVTGNGKLILCDCVGSSADNWGKITNTAGGRGLFVGSSSGSSKPMVEMYGGNITGNTRNHDSDTFGAGVYLGGGAQFTMYNGGITQNISPAVGGGMYMCEKATFVMYNGAISENTAINGGGLYCEISSASQSSVTIQGGVISGNNATAQGGGLYVRRSSFNDSVHDVVINGGSITENTAYNMGAGLMVDNAHVKMNSGTISNNTCTNGSGGGVATYQSGRLHMSGGSITGNKADTGAGVYVGATFYVEGAATVTGNTSTSDKPNNIYLGTGRCFTVCGQLTGTLGVYTYDTPTADSPVRYLAPSNYTITAEDLEHTISDRTADIFSIKNIDQYNYGVFGYVKYKVTIATTENGTVTATPAPAAAGEMITLTVDPASAYKLDTLTVNSGAVTVSKTNDTTYTFTMPAGDVTVAATFSKLKYNITNAGAKNGTVTVTGDTSVEWGTTVTLTNTPDLGFELVDYIVTDASGNAVSVSDDGRFTMPASNVTVSATFQVDASHAHAPCGGNTCTDSQVHPSHDVQRYRPWDGEGDLTLEAGENYYYLTSDVTINSMIYIESGQELYLCFGGHSLKTNFDSGNFAAFYIRSGSDGKLVLCDCAGGGKITPTKTTGELGRGIEAHGGSVEMYGGKITGCISGDKSTYRGDGSGVHIENGTFTMYGGEISNNKSNYSYSYGGGVYVEKGQFIMHGGTISGNKAHYGGGICGINSTITITGGTISGNQTTSDGGGIYARSRLVMSGGSISNNTSAGNGGGIYNDVALSTINGGTISGNNAKCGGGIYNNKGLLELNGGTVTENTANTAGGICSNLTSAYSDAVSISGNVNVSENKDDKGASNFHLFKGDCLTLTGPLKEQISVYTVDTPDANAPVRFLQSSDSHTVTQADMECIASDRSGSYFVKNIDRENYGIFGKLQYTVTVTSGDNGSAEADYSLAESGTVVKLTAKPNTGYQLKEWQIVSGGVTVANDEFTMGSTDVEIKAIFEPASFNYTVETYMMDINGEYGVPDTASATGVFGSEVALIPEQVEGFTLDTDASTLSGEVKADGSLVLKVYYSRNQYKFTYIVDGQETAAACYYGASVPVPATPGKAGHTFAGWDKELPATMPANDVTVTATWTINEYTISWDTDGDGEVDDTTSVAYGEMPSHADGIKAADAQYTYTFTGWSPDVVKVTGAATYTATYSNSINTYTVTWVDEDGTTVLETDEDVPYGTMPSYNGKTPTKAADAQYTYTFSGWSPEIVAVTGEATYTATYSDSTNTYTVTWVDEDGTTVLEKDEGVPYGTMPSYDGAKPTKTATAQYTYTFDKWSPEISAVSGTVIYKATYTATTNKYTIQFVNEDGTVLQTGDVPYGETPAYAGETPTKAADAQYTYTFAGWTPDVVKVTGAATYKATFSNSTNSYTVTWQNEAGELIDAESVAYGGSVTKSPAVPDKLGHTGKWNHDGKNIVQNTIIKPEYTANQYTLTFNTDGGSVIAPITQKYGSAVTAPAAPVKEGWVFQGWDKVLPATMPAENMAFTAKWAPRTTLASFSLSATEIWLHSTQTHQLEVTGLNPSDALCEFTWTSSDTSVLSVDSTGLLTAAAPGTAVLTVKEKWSGLSKTCTVHVASPVTAITFAETALQMVPGDTRTLTATVTCSDQTVTNKLVTFSSSDEKVATVDQNGIVTAVSEGSVTITATAANGVSASCTIKVLLLGDANDDGKVDVADVLIILQYSAGWDVTVNTAKADVTGDGTIGLSDALKILQDCMGGDIALAMRTLQRMLADLNASALEITEQPADQRVKAGETAAFTVTATGDVLKYQWYINRNDGNGWQKLNNAVEVTYVTSTVDADNDGYQYRCVITDAHGNETTTDTAELHVMLDLPNTGDASTPALWLAMCMLSMTGLMILKKKLAIR